MSKGVLEFMGLKDSVYNGVSEEKAFFAKKGGGEWALGKGSVDWSQFQPRTKLYVEWDNWVCISATSNIPEGGGKKPWGGKPNVYHPETFVSNVCGQAIQAGLIKSPADLPQWASQATSVIMAIQGKLNGKQAETAPQAPIAPPQEQPPNRILLAEEGDIPFN